MIFDDPTTKDPGLRTRMQNLVALNGLRDRYICERNKDGLVSLADQYRERGMHNTAKEVMREADQM